MKSRSVVGIVVSVLGLRVIIVRGRFVGRVWRRALVLSIMIRRYAFGGLLLTTLLILAMLNVSSRCIRRFGMGCCRRRLVRILRRLILYVRAIRRFLCMRWISGILRLVLTFIVLRLRFVFLRRTWFGRP